MKNILKTKELGIGAILLLVCIIITLINPVFLTADNLADVLKANAVLGILAVGMTLIIITGGIDVSVAAVTSAVAVAIGHLMLYLPDHPVSLVVVFAAAVFAGTLLGMINGFFIVKFSIPPIVVTLGTLSIISGALLFITNGNYMSGANFPEVFTAFSKYEIFGISILIYILLFFSLITWGILKYTVIGRSIYAFGGNSVSAVRVGISMKKVQYFIYGYMGFLAGIAAVTQTAYIRAVDPNGLLGFELTVIAAVVIGGASILGGNGSIAGTLLGTLLLGVMQNGLILARVDSYWQNLVTGTVIILAVSYDHLQKKRIDAQTAQIEVK
ncbi:simple sugar transport system permease protein/ribose transport system permease protein [Evansella caseinilytica]|uniref:Simple sugar transport system permease protein/ribose transport system permease protein n=1 Tax=Evansella caseinilytica TaxID=1503961 RepID=A0A1H3H6S7_9BACI|nr:ABC transporter permease [Evansella caseinilytica]SDY11222.1 simple sugar transport system permease protein/ribose transport system permease protein [Evansella caseinilytica]